MASAHSDLSADQGTALTQLLARIPAAERRDEQIVLKYLRATNFEMAAAFEKYMASQKWRRDNHVDEVLKAPPLPPHRMQLLKTMLPCCYHGVDREGRPLYFAKSGDVDVDVLLHSISDAELLQAHVWGMEYSVQRARDSSATLGRPITTFSSVVDMAGQGSSQKKLMKFAEAFAKLDEAHYPHTLGFCAVLNTPWYINTLYAIISPFLSASTRSKIMMLGSNYHDELNKLIAPDQLPLAYGGTCDGTLCGARPCMPPYSAEANRAAARAMDAQHIDDLEKEEVAAGQCSSIEADGEAGTTFSWYIKPESHDIEVSAVFVPFGDAQPVHVILPRRVEASYEFALRGEYVCKTKGELTIVLDNAYSMWTGKSVLYSLLATPAQ